MVMKRVIGLGSACATLLSSLLLGACSALIPPQVLPNPIGISGRQVQVEIGASGELHTAAAGLGTLEASFSDLDTSAVPISLTLTQSLFEIGFAKEATLTSRVSALPCNIFLTRVDIIVTVSDALQTYTLPAFKLNKVIELEQQPGDLSRYRFVTEDVFVGNVLADDDLTKLQALITTGGSNTVMVQVIIEATSAPELPPGSTLTLTFETSEATLAF
jgi:hypothetical protein